MFPIMVEDLICKCGLKTSQIKPDQKIPVCAYWIHQIKIPNTFKYVAAEKPRVDDRCTKDKPVKQSIRTDGRISIHKIFSRGDGLKNPGCSNDDINLFVRFKDPANL